MTRTQLSETVSKNSRPVKPSVDKLHNGLRRCFTEWLLLIELAAAM